MTINKKIGKTYSMLDSDKKCQEGKNNPGRGIVKCQCRRLTFQISWLGKVSLRRWLLYPDLKGVSELTLTWGKRRNSK